MKSIIKLMMLLVFFGVNIFAQVYVQEPDAPRAFVWGGEKMTEKEEQQYLEKITNPQIKKELQEIKKLDERKYYSLLRETSFLSLPSLYSVGTGEVSIVGGEREENDLRKQITELEIYSEVLGVKYKNAGQADKQKLADQLKDTLGKIFDLRENQRKEEVEKLEKKLTELKESIKIRKDNKQQIVEDRFRTLTGKGKYLKWD